MTNEEAIKELKKHISICMYTLYDTDEHLEAEHLAIIVLEKQIPKKPITKITPTPPAFGSEVTGLFCPNCMAILDRHYNECHHCVCGQAIDWREDE